MQKKLITLALQGGGSHGAFTWGVLDRLLEDERIEIEGISGASAGAINAALLAHGITAGGREDGRQALETFWRSVASRAPLGLTRGDWSGSAEPGARNPGPAVNALIYLTRYFSPYQLNPLNLNPLREILAEQVDFERIRSDCGIKLFIAATQVATGKPRISWRDYPLCLVPLFGGLVPLLLHHPLGVGGGEEVEQGARFPGRFRAGEDARR